LAIVFLLVDISKIVFLFNNAKDFFGDCVESLGLVLVGTTPKSRYTPLLPG